MKTRILGLLIADRIKEADRTQGILTQYSHIIKSRMGFHEVTEDVCSRSGIILLQLAGDHHDWDKLEHDLAKIGGIEVQQMTFNF